MNQEYLITLLGKEKRKTIRIGYRDGLLTSFSVPENEQYTDMELTWLMSWLRSNINEGQLHDNAADPSMLIKFRVAKVEQDLSFDAFWNTYDYKVGNKSKVIKQWKLLSDDEKVQVFVSIKKYNFFLQLNPTTDKIYPERYLSQRRWENEYKI